MSKAFRKPDTLILLAVAAVAAVLLVIGHFGGGAAYVEVSHGGAVVTALPLDRDTLYEMGGNTVEVKDGAARMVSADCSDGLCVQHVPISKSGESIICLPNRVVLTARQGAKRDLDAVVG